MLNRLLAEERLALAGHNYVDFHRERFDYLIEKCRELCPDGRAKVLDIGRSHLSSMLLQVYGSVTTLGLYLSAEEQFGHEMDSQASNGRPYAGHIVFDLNDAQSIEQIDTDERFAVIVFAETIEHLYTAPELVLALLANLLSPGGIIICQTPNASSLRKRVMLLLGRNPYERLRIDAGNRGHIREYTRHELISVGRRAGLSTILHEYQEYFGVKGGRMIKTLLKVVATVCPSLARAQTIVYTPAVDAWRPNKDRCQSDTRHGKELTSHNQ